VVLSKLFKLQEGGTKANSISLYCQVLMEEPVDRFVLPIEIADFTGFIRTTTFY